jgi:hypothetical protein
MELDSLIQIFGSAGVTFYIMWLWLKSVQEEKNGVIRRLEAERENRVNELKEIIPLLNDASKGLQEVIKSNQENSDEVVNEIIAHIDSKITEITKNCNK